MERCQGHVVCDGEITRSKKMNGVVERVRRCTMCSSLFKTFERTEDQVIRQNGEHDMEIRDLKRELKYYKELVGLMKQIQESQQELAEELIREYA